MTRTWRRRSRVLPLAAAAVCVALLGSGCVNLVNPLVNPSPGVVRLTLEACGAGSTDCAPKGNLGLNASTGVRQLLLGLEVPTSAVVSPAITSNPVLAFSPSPGYAAELQRLDPASSGRTWVGWTSAPFFYEDDLSLPRRVAFTITITFPPGPDGAPVSSLAGLVLNGRAAPGARFEAVAGVRNITPAGPAGRPVACGVSLTTANADVPDAGDGNGPAVTFCDDTRLSGSLRQGDYGVVTSDARASAPAGTVASVPFVLRNSGMEPDRFGPATIRATTTLPGAAVAPVPGTLSPGKDEDASALVAVGIPAGAAPGAYDVTLTATLKDGTVRTGVGKLTVLAPPPGTGSGTGGGPGTGGGAITARTLTTVLPRGLTVASARANGVPVLLGSTVAGPALVRLQQGPRKKPTVSIGKRIRLKAPGPVKVTFRSRKLAKGPYRISISVGGKVVKTVTGRLTQPAR